MYSNWKFDNLLFDGFLGKDPEIKVIVDGRCDSSSSSSSPTLSIGLFLYLNQIASTHNASTQEKSACIYFNVQLPNSYILLETHVSDPHGNRHAKEIASDLKCAVCLGILVKTTLVAEVIVSLMNASKTLPSFSMDSSCLHSVLTPILRRMSHYGTSTR